MGLYNIVKYPILNIKQSLKAFLLQLKINYRDVKVKRSFSIIGIILQNIIKAASMEGLSRVGIFSENLEVQNIFNFIGKSLSNKKLSQKGRVEFSQI